MSSTYAEPLDLVERGLDDLAAIDPGHRTTAEKQQFLLRVARAKARLVAEELRVLAASDDYPGEARFYRSLETLTPAYVVAASGRGRPWLRVYRIYP